MITIAGKKIYITMWRDIPIEDRETDYPTIEFTIGDKYRVGRSGVLQMFLWHGPDSGMIVAGEDIPPALVEIGEKKLAAEVTAILIRGM